MAQKYFSLGDSEAEAVLLLGMKQFNKKEYQNAVINIKKAYLLEPTCAFLLELVLYVDFETSILFYPHRLLKKIGGSRVLWLGTIGAALILTALHLTIPLMILVFGYLLFCIYLWLSAWLYKKIN